MSEKINAGYMYARLRQGKVPCVKELTFLGKSIIMDKNNSERKCKAWIRKTLIGRI